MLNRDDRRILLVDDDSTFLESIKRGLGDKYSFETALNPREALALLRECGPYAAIVADMQMPDMSGVDLLIQARTIAPDTVRLMFSGDDSRSTPIQAVNEGAIFRFISKPCLPEILEEALDASLHRYDETQVERRVLEQTLAGTVSALRDTLLMIDAIGFGRGERLRDSVRFFGHSIGMLTTWDLEVAAMLAHIGYMSVPTPILKKMEAGIPLQPNEKVIVTRTPLLGHNVFKNIPRMESVAQIILYQDKHFDGTGYPVSEVNGEKIPFGARVLKIFKDRLKLEEEGIVRWSAFEAMKVRVGIYDPALLEKVFHCFPDFLQYNIDSARPVLTKNIADLEVGMLLVSDVKTGGGELLLTAGNRLTETMINRLKNYAELERMKEPLYVQIL